MVTVSAGALLAVLAAAERAGACRDSMRAVLPVEAIPEEAHARLPLTMMALLDADIVRQLGPHAPRRVAETMAAHPATIVGYLAGCARNLRELFGLLTRYWPLHMDGVELALTTNGSRARFGLRHGAPLPLTSPTMQREQALWQALARRLAGTAFVPHAARDDAGAMEFDAAMLDQPTVRGDVVLLRYLQPTADELLSRQAAHGDFSQHVRAVAVQLIGVRRLCIDNVARALAMSPRTLQRRLESEGTTFGEVCDESRRLAALQHLRDSRMAIKEVACVLGFSETSTFYRAFRRWTGATPAHFRRTLAA